MDLTALTVEERSALTALARSPGWTLLVEKLFLPQMQLATRFLDRPAAEQSGRGDWMRGVKAAYMNAVEIVYHVAGIPNPLVRHALGLLADIKQQSEEDGLHHLHHGQPVPRAGTPAHELTHNEKKEDRTYYPRSSFPV
jgi:hypothetical protein